MYLYKHISNTERIISWEVKDDNHVATFAESFELYVLSWWHTVRALVPVKPYAQFMENSWNLAISLHCPHHSCFLLCDSFKEYILHNSGTVSLYLVNIKRVSPAYTLQKNTTEVLEQVKNGTFKSSPTFGVFHTAPWKFYWSLCESTSFNKILKNSYLWQYQHSLDLCAL